MDTAQGHSGRGLPCCFGAVEGLSLRSIGPATTIIQAARPGPGRLFQRHAERRYPSFHIQNDQARVYLPQRGMDRPAPARAFFLFTLQGHLQGR